jgi:hypothetical protein
VATAFRIGTRLAGGGRIASGKCRSIHEADARPVTYYNMIYLCILSSAEPIYCDRYFKNRNPLRWFAEMNASDIRGATGTLACET